jgi:3-phosphoshikimate 1-carboxyvinyltransferase
MITKSPTPIGDTPEVDGGTLRKVGRINKEFDIALNLPGSKSMTLRHFLLAGLAHGQSIIRSWGICDDTNRMIEALKNLGVSVQVSSDAVIIDGSGGSFSPNGRSMFLGGSGVSSRFLLPVLGLMRGEVTLDGDDTLRARPHGPLINSLRSLGGHIQARNDQYLPITVRGTGELGSEVSVDCTESSQYLSALLQIGPCLPEGIRVTIAGKLASAPYLGITLREMQKFGAVVEAVQDGVFQVSGGGYTAVDTVVEGDASAASYLAGLATLHGGAITLNNLNQDTDQGDLRFLELCEQLGARVEFNPSSIRITGPSKGLMRNVSSTIAMDDIPDTAPTLIAMAPFIPGITKITGLSTLRIKECDRLEAPVRELRKLNVPIEVGHDWIAVGQLPSTFEGGNRVVFETYHDHRIAMSLALTASRIGGIEIANPSCVNKTYPNFWRDLGLLGA